MTVQALRAGGGSRRIAGAGFGLAVIAVVMLALAPIGWRAGWWHYRTSFSVLLEYGAYVGAAAALVSVVGLGFALAAGHRRSLVLALVGLIAGATVAYVPWSFSQAGQRVPRIHDITTDIDNPPVFAAVMKAREAEKANSVAYEGEAVSKLQKQAYPDIAPVLTALPPPQAFERALATAQGLGWTIVASVPAEGRIEASQTSFWFGFTDDVVVRVQARSDGQPGSRVDLRSVSRNGRNDFGVNANRIRGFTAALRGQPGV
jgi:uncharacterized protein (DUF1499 family)